MAHRRPPARAAYLGRLFQRFRNGSNDIEENDDLQAYAMQHKADDDPDLVAKHAHWRIDNSKASQHYVDNTSLAEQKVKPQHLDDDRDEGGDQKNKQQI